LYRQVARSSPVKDAADILKAEEREKFLTKLFGTKPAAISWLTADS